jgi:protein-L-isoaspartate(D-aspartate) O-methyltransferase
VHDRRVIDAMAAVPRERFVPPDLRALAYDDRALPIGEGQTISQPLIVALMMEALALKPGDRVLEVGTGSGYQAAVLSRLAREVVTVERIDALLRRAVAVLDELGCANVRAYLAGDALGRPEDAPYDAIVVAAGAPHVPRTLVDQLAPAGRLVLPIGTLRSQELVRVTNTSHGTQLERLGPCAFVPLIAREAWREEDRGEASRRFKVR